MTHRRPVFLVLVGCAGDIDTDSVWTSRTDAERRAEAIRGWVQVYDLDRPDGFRADPS